MIKYIIVFTLFLTGLNAQNNWDIKSCIDYAVKHNIQLKQADLNNQINKNNSDQSKANILPTINLGASHTYNFGKTIDRFTNTFANTQVLSQNFFISSNVVLFNGFSQYNNLKANEYAYLSSAESLKQQQYDLTLNVVNMYLNVIFTDELAGISKGQYKITQEQLDRTKKMVDAGALAKSVQFDIEAQLANEEVNVTNAENNYQLALLSLRQIMNLDSVGSFNVVKPNLDVEGQSILKDDVQSIYETALKNQPGIKSAEYSLLSSEKTLATARGRRYPTVSMNGSMGTGTSGLAKDITGFNIVGYDTTAVTTGGQYVLSPRTELVTKSIPFADQFKDNVNKSFGFTVSVPIFNGLQTHTGVKNAKLNLINARYSQDLAKQNLYKTIAQAYTTAKAALSRYMANKKSVEASQASFNFADQKFNVGSISAFDYNTAKNRLLVAQSNLLQSKYDYILRLKVLDFYQGKDLTF
ncbi:MAG: TolC family protein [Bacteroidota bacterium]|nr:TolC family protein [Bacteroidota bacterium]